MKKAVATFVILTSLILNTVAQPNGGFEYWTAEYSYENPDDWQTFNFLSILGPPNPLSAFKAVGFDKYSGNYALKLKSVFVNNNPMPGNIPDTFGCAFKGKILLTPTSFKAGFPYTGRPEKLEFYSKYLPVGNDSGVVGVYLRKWNGLIYDTIGMGLLTISTTPTYEVFELGINYSSLEQPDSAIIVFYSSKDSTTARVGSTLFVDDVIFKGWVGIDEHTSYSDKVQLFPNPAKDNVTIVTEIEEAENVRVIDVAGKIIGWFKIQNYKASINTSLFAEGIYFYEMLDKKEQVLTKGKFNIVK
ncbi:MAG: T9SS type A sorting domain-containing protein [Bacteroidota bacterium]